MDTNNYRTSFSPVTLGRWLPAIAIIAIVCHPCIAAEPAGVRFFEQEVRPLLADRCFSCHGTRKQESALRLDTRDGILSGGDRGPAAVPGDPDASLMIAAVRHQGELAMPKDRAPLTDAEIRILSRWIDAGMPWTKNAVAETALGDQEALAAKAKTHWAFQPIRKPAMPAAHNDDWVQTPIDAFILSKLRQAELKPSPPADKLALLRRLSFGLTGLPPTPAETAAFLADKSPKATASLVDRLLASPHYGERWGRHWLDVARYADTRDWHANLDVRYPFAYTYRDWVINAFNNDLPYDQFVKLQVAADHYESDKRDLAALGLLTVGPRFRNNRHEQIADKIDVVTRGFMGLTVSCARCHDHKYDPVPIEDYYALHGIFNSTEISDPLPELPGYTAPPKLRQDFDRKYGKVAKAEEDYYQKLTREARADQRRRLPAYMEAFYELEITKSASVRKLITTKDLKETVMTPMQQQLRRVADKRYRDDPIFGLLHSTYRSKPATFQTTYDAARNRLQKQLNPFLAATINNEPPTSLKDLLRLYGKTVSQALKSTADNAESPPGAVAIVEAFESPDGLFYLEQDRVVGASRLLGPGRKAIEKLQKAVAEVVSTHPGAPAKAMAVQDADKVRNSPVFKRGDPQRRGDVVPRRFLSVLTAGKPQAFRDGSGRRQLAEAIASPDNPLTARVFVNWVWTRHFGQGLAEYADDFGLQAPPPSHPELLDWLAADFIANGWSVKRLHRQIVLSATYQQSSRARAAADRDPANRLLSRSPRRRLDFEAMRDAIIAVSGRLDPTVGGRSVRFGRDAAKPRRTLYGYVDRVEPAPLLSTFDFPIPDRATMQRSETTVPQQALFVMNDPFMVEQTKALAAAVTADTLDERIAKVYLRLLGRRPHPPEIKFAKAFIDTANDIAATDSSGGVWQYGYGPADAAIPATQRFHPAPHWTGVHYQAAAEFPDKQLGHLRLTKSGGHPGNSLDQAWILRWQAPRTMHVRISGKLEHRRNKGDGIRARIISSKHGELASWNAFMTTTPTTLKPRRVEKGEFLDFTIDCIEHPTADSFGWTPRITEVGDMAAAEAGESWDAFSDFAGPPPPPLSPWQQWVQAMMLTNEFLFLD